MAKNTSIWLAGLSSIALISGAALAQTTTADQKMDEAAAHSDAAAEQAGEALEDAASATGQAAENAADATADAASDAANATADAASDAATATSNAVENAADATGNAVENAADATGDAMDDATDAASSEMAATEEGTPVEGQIFEQDENTFLASTLLDASIINTAGESIGDVDDLIMTADGQVNGVVVGVGGFLGVGEKLVALEMNQFEIQFDDDGDLVFSVNTTEEALENAPAFVTAEEQERAAERAASAASAPTTTAPATTQ